MAHDPELIADTRAWLAKAAQDLAAGAYELQAVPPFAGDVAFHAQQAAEKALKAFLVWHGCPFRKTHNLEEVGEQCLKLDGTLRHLIDRSTPLTEYAWKFRYPGEPEEPSREEAGEALATAREVYEAVLARLPADVRP
jgi:HEPN domain-containing protein